MGWVASVTPRPRFTPGERNPCTHCTGGWAGPRAGLDKEVRGKILSPLLGIEPPTPGRQPVARHYTDWATLLTIEQLLCDTNFECVRKSADEIRKRFFQSLKNKTNEPVVSGNNSTDIFTGLVTTGFGPDVARGPWVWPRYSTIFILVTIIQLHPFPLVNRPRQPDWNRRYKAERERELSVQYYACPKNSSLCPISLINVIKQRAESSITPEFPKLSIEHCSRPPTARCE
jgi:hypothetical protein